MFGAHVRLFNCKSEPPVQTRDNYAYGNEQTQTILRYGQKNYKFEDSIAFFITFLSQSKHIRKILLKQDILLLSKNFKMKKKTTSPNIVIQFHIELLYCFDPIFPFR